MIDILVVLIAYLLGAIPFGLIIARFYGIEDLRAVGSGNIGATNVLRSAGVIPALLVTILDIAKGIAAVLIARYFGGALFADTEYLVLLAGLAAIIGHIFSIFVNFRGGKGVNTALGVFVTLLPVPTLIALGMFIITVLIGRYVSLGSIIAAITLPAAIIIMEYFRLAVFHEVYLPVTIILALLIIFTHRSNIKRLMSGSENRFSFHSKARMEANQNG